MKNATTANTSKATTKAQSAARAKQEIQAIVNSALDKALHGVESTTEIEAWTTDLATKLHGVVADEHLEAAMLTKAIHYQFIGSKVDARQRDLLAWIAKNSKRGVMDMIVLMEDEGYTVGGKVPGKEDYQNFMNDLKILEKAGKVAKSCKTWGDQKTSSPLWYAI